jgi:PAS domain S-box-containing protein
MKISSVKSGRKDGKNPGDKKRAEEFADALRESELRFRTLANAMPQLVWTANPDGVVDYYNERYKEFDGLRQDASGNWIWSPVLHPDDVESTVNAWNHAVAAGEIYQIEHRVKNSAGDFNWYLSRGVPERDASGKVVKWYGTATNIDHTKKTEQALRISEERYRSLFDNMTEGFAIHEIITNKKDEPVDYRFLNINQAFEKLTGLKRSELIGKRVKEVMPDTEAYWIENYGKVAITGEPLHFEDFSAALGRWYEVFAYRTAPKQFAVIFTDITVRKETEKALRESETSLQQAQVVGKIGSWRLDLVKNELVWSDENYRIFGIEIGKPLTYESFISTIHPDDREFVDNRWKAAMAGEEYDIEHRIIADGMVKWLHEKAFLDFDENGKLSAGFGISQDITEKKNAEMELIGSKRKLDLALENANIGLWEWDLKTDSITWDIRTENMFGISQGSFEGNYDAFLKLVHEEDVDHIRKAVRNTIKENKPYETIFRIKAPDGNPRYISSKALVNKDSNGEIIGMTGVNFDITDLKQGTELLISKLNEDLLKSNKELESFAYITSHDLQEPLRMVTSFSQLLEKQYGDRLDDRAREYIGFAVDGAKRMYELINGLLTYSRMSRKEITFSNVDFNKVVESVRSNLSLIIKERECEIESDKLPVVFADYNQMIHLFQNLISNGIKFSTDSPRIRISAKTEKTQFVFSVRDEGIGIEPQYFDKIFMIFKRLLPRDQYEGTGIGLAICKRIVENHGGQIWVESEPEKGSCFYFTIAKKQYGV